jgi:hypothetical protein
MLFVGYVFSLIFFVWVRINNEDGDLSLSPDNELGPRCTISSFDSISMTLNPRID